MSWPHGDHDLAVGRKDEVFAPVHRAAGNRGEDASSCGVAQPDRAAGPGDRHAASVGAHIESTEVARDRAAVSVVVRTSPLAADRHRRL